MSRINADARTLIIVLLVAGAVGCRCGPGHPSPMAIVKPPADIAAGSVHKYNIPPTGFDLSPWTLAWTYRNTGAFRSSESDRAAAELADAGTITNALLMIGAVCLEAQRHVGTPVATVTPTASVPPETLQKYRASTTWPRCFWPWGTDLAPETLQRYKIGASGYECGDSFIMWTWEDDEAFQSGEFNRAEAEMVVLHGDTGATWKAAALLAYVGNRDSIDVLRRARERIWVRIPQPGVGYAALHEIDYTIRALETGDPPPWPRHCPGR